jgi:hypothetical protein
MTICKKLSDGLLKGCQRPKDILGYARLMKELHSTGFWRGCFVVS